METRKHAKAKTAHFGQVTGFLHDSFPVPCNKLLAQRIMEHSHES